MIDVPTRVKEALQEGCFFKNYRFIVLNDNGTEDFTIDNHNLVSESVNIDERLCSGETIKFGLCEGSRLQFEYFGYPDLTGRRLHAYIDVQYKDANGQLQWYEIPMGFFDVENCPIQFSTGIRKCSCYNKLKSDYLDAKVNDLIEGVVADGEVGIKGTATIDTILMRLLDGYAIEPKFNKANYNIPDSWMIVEGTYGFRTSDNFVILAPKGYVYIDISNISPNSAYRFYVNRAKVQEALRETMGVYANIYAKNIHSTNEFERLFDVVTRGDVYHILVIARETNGRGGINCFMAQGNDEYVSEHIIKKYTEDVVEISFPMVYIRYPMDYAPTVKGAWEEIPEVERKAIMKKWSDFFNDERNFRIEVRDSNGLGSFEITTPIVGTLPDVTLRKLQSSVYELSCQFGRLDRVTDLFSGRPLNNERLFPAETLYPSNDLYPKGDSIRARKSTYQQLWAEDGSLKKFRYLIVTYNTLDEEGNKTKAVLQRTVNADGNTDYNMSDNWLFNNLIWTEEEIAEYADSMVEKMKNVTWFPFEMWGAGLPFIETGDEIEIVVGNETYTTYILQRQMKGIQNLADNYMNGVVDIF